VLSPGAKRIAVHILPAIHLCICLATALGAFDNEWGSWFVVFLIDFPASILGLFLANVLPQALAFVAVGTTWWYLLSIAVLRFLGSGWRQTHGRGPG
jgi:hypothetical protein